MALHIVRRCKGPPPSAPLSPKRGECVGFSGFSCFVVVCLPVLAPIFQPACQGADGADPSPLAILERASASGDLKARIALANAYFNGSNGAKTDKKKAFELYKSAANAGSSAACFDLALCYDSGQGVRKNPLLAFKYYRKASDAGVLPAMFNLAICYQTGICDKDGKELVPRDPDLAESYFTELVNKGFPLAFKELARVFLARGGEKEADYARKLLKKGAALGDPAAMTLLADTYRYGIGGARDVRKSAVWLQKAANAGNAEAMGKLSYCYERGEGVDKNPELFLQYLQKAAEGGLPSAQYKLGGMYASGDLGLPQDIQKARFWFEKASKKKDARALFALGVMALEGVGEKKDEAKGVRLVRKAAELGEPHAQYNMGIFYSQGRGVKRDFQKAFKWFSRAAAQGDPKAMRELGFCFLKGEGTEENFAKGMVLVKKAAEAGDTQAAAFLRDVLSFH